MNNWVSWIKTNANKLAEPTGIKWAFSDKQPRKTKLLISQGSMNQRFSSLFYLHLINDQMSTLCAGMRFMRMVSSSSCVTPSPSVMIELIRSIMCIWTFWLWLLLWGKGICFREVCLNALRKAKVRRPKVLMGFLWNPYESQQSTYRQITCKFFPSSW